MRNLGDYFDGLTDITSETYNPFEVHFTSEMLKDLLTVADQQRRCRPTARPRHDEYIPPETVAEKEEGLLADPEPGSEASPIAEAEWHLWQLTSMQVEIASMMISRVNNTVRWSWFGRGYGAGVQRKRGVGRREREEEEGEGRGKGG